MQAIESQNLILYQTDLRGQWRPEAAQAFARRLPYARRLALLPMRSESRASLAGIALALRALRQFLGRTVEPSEIVFQQGEKPRLAAPAALAAGDCSHARARAARWEEAGVDFSISHAGPWVACVALAHGRVGLDLEMGTDERIADWVVREAALKASGQGLCALKEVEALAIHSGRLSWRGEIWHVRRLEGFEGARACVVSSVEVHEVEAHATALAELFGS
jgi:phosphopantetheinyl transferase